VADEHKIIEELMDDLEDESSSMLLELLAFE
jgi:hypothetical protein